MNKIGTIYKPFITSKKDNDFYSTAERSADSEEAFLLFSSSNNNEMNSWPQTKRRKQNKPAIT